MKIIFKLKTNEGLELQGFENDLRELVINGVVIVSNGNMDTTQMEEVMELSQLNNPRLPNGDLN